VIRVICHTSSHLSLRLADSRSIGCANRAIANVSRPTEENPMRIIVPLASLFLATQDTARSREPSPSPASCVAIERMPFVRFDSARADPMPVLRPDTARLERMPVFKPRCGDTTAPRGGVAEHSPAGPATFDRP
jgi:hypothetical protein